jgi:Fe-S-cluster containining protein
MNTPEEQEVLRGLVYSHNRANANTTELHKAAVTLQAVVELLIERGVLDRETLEARREAATENLRRHFLERGMAVAVQEFGFSKYEFQSGAVLDCENRLHLCKAACCKLPFALSKEDVEEGTVRWDLGKPYLIAHGEDGYCVHLDREQHCCGVYGQRPIPCRGYDCSQDKRIWIDFEKMIINPRIEEPDWPACLNEDQETQISEET